MGNTKTGPYPSILTRRHVFLVTSALSLGQGQGRVCSGDLWRGFLGRARRHAGEGQGPVCGFDGHGVGAGLRAVAPNLLGELATAPPPLRGRRLQKEKAEFEGIHVLKRLGSGCFPAQRGPAILRNSHVSI